ncbi:MAG: DNA alkylation repair protein [Muribaculaceae bacterium]|nr:DNA alkylation repair protein [Muribaculaceae bacterium]
MTVREELCERMVAEGDEAQARHLSRFFKTGPGQYGEGDCFLGVRVPETRRIVSEYKGRIGVEDVRILTESRYHEVRLAGFLCLIDIYNAAKRRRADCREIVDIYLSLLDRGNNWDLVDVISPKILGDYLVTHADERGLLYELAAMEGRLWHQRVAMVSCWTLIREGEYDDALRLAEGFLNHKHDLMHKAVGWMLREVGKRGGEDELYGFLDRYAKEMPRTMLRYAIEKLSAEDRARYMER